MQKASEIKSIKEKNLDALYKQLNKTRLNLAKTKKDVYRGKIKNYNKIKAEKKKIARLLTVIYEKEAERLRKNEENK